MKTHRYHKICLADHADEIVGILYSANLIRGTAHKASDMGSDGFIVFRLHNKENDIPVQTVVDHVAQRGRFSGEAFCACPVSDRHAYERLVVRYPEIGEQGGLVADLGDLKIEDRIGGDGYISAGHAHAAKFRRGIIITQSDGINGLDRAAHETPVQLTGDGPDTVCVYHYFFTEQFGQTGRRQIV